MQTIHLVALDMDGTLLNGRKEVTSGTLQALRRLRSLGIPAALSTGRARAEVEIYPELMELVPFAVLTSGALVTDLRDGSVILEKTISRSTAAQALALAAQEDTIPHLLTKGHSVCPKHCISLLAEHHMGAYTGMFERICLKPQSMEDYLKTAPEEALKLNFYHLSVEAQARNKERLRGLPLQLTYAEYSSLECTAPGVAKDTGLMALCQHLGTSMEHVLAVGDSENDLPMLKAAGLPVAMGNAPENVRAAARFLTKDNENDGAAAAILEYLPFMEPIGGIAG